MRQQSLIRLASAFTIAAATAGLLLRAHQAIPQVTARSQAMASSHPSSAFVSPTEPSPYWKIAYEVGRYKDNKCNVMTSRLDGTDAQRILQDASTPCWSPDRGQLAFQRGGNLWVSRSDGSRQRQITFWPPNELGRLENPICLEGIAWNAQAQIVSFGRKEHFQLILPNGAIRKLTETTIFHASLNPGARSKRFPFVESPTASPADPADFINYPGHRDLPPMDIVEDRSPFAFSQNSWPAWSPSGNRLAFVRNGDIWLADHDPAFDKAGDTPIWDVKRIAACALYDDGVGHGSHDNESATGVSWAPDESYVMFGRTRIDGSGERDIFKQRLKRARNSAQIAADGDPVMLPIYNVRSTSISPDGKWIIATDGNAMIAETLDGKTIRTLPIRGGSHPVW